MAPTMDWGGFLSDQLKKSQDLAVGYSGQIHSFREQLDEADRTATNSYAPVLGGALLGGLAGALAGGGVRNIVRGAGLSGEMAVNNLEEQEKQKREEIFKDLTQTQGLLKDQINFSQSMAKEIGDNLYDQSENYDKGLYPGTDPYLANMEAEKDLIRAREQEKQDPIVNPDVRKDLEELRGEKFDSNIPLTMKDANLSYDIQTEKRRVKTDERNEEKWQKILSQNKIAGVVEIVPGRASSDAIKKVEELGSQYQNIKAANEELAKMFEQYGENLFTGDLGSAFSQKVARITNAYRTLYLTGANLTGKEQPMLFTNAPADFNIIGWGDIIKRKLLSQGSGGLLREADKNLDSIFANTLLGLNYADPFYAGYSPDQKKRYNLDQVFQRARDSEANQAGSKASSDNLQKSSDQSRIEQLEKEIAEAEKRLGAK